MLRIRAFAVLASLVIVTAGCGPAPPKLVPVSGIVTIQDSPLPYGNITLVPATDKGNTLKSEPRGTIGPDGQYTLETDGQPGAPVGEYRVTVFSVKPSTPEDGMKPPEWAASQEYSDASKSGLTLRVVENPQPNEYDIRLTKK